MRAVSVGKRTGGFEWLEPVPESYPLTVADLIASEPIDAASIDLLVVGVLGSWLINHEHDHQALARPLPTRVEGLKLGTIDSATRPTDRSPFRACASNEQRL